MNRLLVLALALTATSCDGARKAELDRQITLLRTDIAATRALLARMSAGLGRARRHLSPEVQDLSPPSFNAWTPLPPGDPDRPDVILLSIDTLRADHLGSYGYSRNTSPNLDRMAREGTRFANHWSVAPWTLPAHTTMLSGLTPSHHGTIEDHVRIREEVPLLQESFRQAGYATVGAVATMFVSTKYGFDRGFDRFEDFGVNDKRVNNQSVVDAEHVFNHALHFAQNQADGQPIFAFLHVYDVHYHYNPPEPWNEKFDRPPRLGDAIYKSYFDYKKDMIEADQLAHQVAQYDEEIAYVDHVFGELIDRWRRSGRRLVVAVTADHGEEFGERGSWGHAHTLFFEQLHVPWIVWGDGVRQQVISARTGSEDIAPTLAGLAGVPFAQVDGLDRERTVRTGLPIREPHTPGAYADTSRFETVQYRWHNPPYDLILDLGKNSRGLCNLADDPRCTRNLFKVEKEVAQRMVRELSDYLGQPWIAQGEATIELPEGTYAYKGLDRFKKSMPVAAGERFAVHPLDAYLTVKAEGAEPGPYGALGKYCRIPPGEPLGYDGPFSCDESGKVVLSAEDKALLESLGYIQGDDEDEAAPEGSGEEAPEP